MSKKASLQLIIALLSINFIWVLFSFIYYVNSIEAIVSSSRMLLSAVLIYFIHKKIDQTALINILIYLTVFNGALIFLQVIEQVLSLDMVPPYLRYGGIWGFSESHDYEIFKKGGLFPSTQTSSILSLFVAWYIIAAKKPLRLLIPISMGLVFGSRTTMILLLLLLSILLIGYACKLLFDYTRTIKPPKKFAYFFIIYCVLFTTFYGMWLDTDLGSHYSLRVQQAFSVVVELDFSGGESEGTAFEYYRAPFNVKEALIGNGLDRYSEFGGNDPFYSRWLLQSGFPSLILLLTIFFVCFTAEFQRTRSYGLVTILLLLNGFKDEIITSFFIFDIYLLYLFSNTPRDAKSRFRNFMMRTAHQL